MNGPSPTPERRTHFAGSGQVALCRTDYEDWAVWTVRNSRQVTCRSCLRLLKLDWNEEARTS